MPPSSSDLAEDPGTAGVVVDQAREVERALRHYRVMAFVVGTGLLILSFAGLPLQYVVGGLWQKVVPVGWTIHGILYIVYLLTAVDLARKARFTLGQMAATVGAGFLPFLAFFVEHRVNVRVSAALAETRPAT